MFMSLFAALAIDPDNGGSLVQMIQAAISGGKGSLVAVLGLILAVLVLRKVVAPANAKLQAFLLNPVVSWALPSVLAVLVTVATGLAESTLTLATVVGSILNALLANALYNGAMKVKEASSQ
jgi:hypothetical protein